MFVKWCLCLYVAVFSFWRGKFCNRLSYYCISTTKLFLCASFWTAFRCMVCLAAGAQAILSSRSIVFPADLIPKHHITSHQITFDLKILLPLFEEDLILRFFLTECVSAVLFHSFSLDEAVILSI